MEDKYGQTYKDLDVNSIPHKYTATNRKKVPTVNQACPSKVCIAKRRKDTTGEKIELGLGEDTYNIEKDEFSGDEEVTDDAIEFIKREEGFCVTTTITTSTDQSVTAIHSPR